MDAVLDGRTPSPAHPPNRRVAASTSHAQGLCHRDIKLDNMTSDEDGVLRLIDFGLQRARMTLHDPVGLRYRAPEITARVVRGPMRAWPLGASIFGLLMGHLPLLGARFIAAKVARRQKQDLPIGHRLLLCNGNDPRRARWKGCRSNAER